MLNIGTNNQAGHLFMVTLILIYFLIFLLYKCNNKMPRTSMKSSGNICTFSWVKQQFLMWRQSWNNPQETVHCHCQISSHTGTFWGGTNWTNIGILSGTDCPILTQSTLPFPPSAHLCVWARCGWPFFFVPINTSYTCSTLMRVLMGVVVSLCECMYSAVHVCVWLRVIMRVINVQLVVRVCVCVCVCKELISRCVTWEM